MSRKWITLLIILGNMLVIGAQTGSAAILVEFSPTPANVTVGSTFTVDILADIDATEAIMGWGLDLSISNPSIVSWDSVTLGNSWWSSSTDGDFLGGGLIPTFPPLPATPPIYGNDVHLATLGFTCLGIGISALELSATIGDLYEGFYMMGLIPGVPGPKVDWTYTGGLINQVPIPEPASLLLFGVGLLGLAAIRRKQI